MGTMTSATTSLAHVDAEAILLSSLNAAGHVRVVDRARLVGPVTVTDVS
jgi:hypothetical protein